MAFQIAVTYSDGPCLAAELAINTDCYIVKIYSTAIHSYKGR